MSKTKISSITAAVLFFMSNSAAIAASIKSESGKCLDVHQPCSKENGYNVQVWECADVPNQKWTLTNGQIKSESGKCLDIHQPCSKENGCNVQVWECADVPNQKWSVN